MESAQFQDTWPVGLGLYKATFFKDPEGPGTYKQECLVPIFDFLETGLILKNESILGGGVRSEWEITFVSCCLSCG